MSDADEVRHQVTRIRRETRRRSVIVSATHRLSPAMLRVRFESADLHDFESAGADDHVKLVVPDPSHQGSFATRDYTPRAFDAKAGWLIIDFAVHDAGPATMWALGAKPGDKVQIGGPRGSAVVKDDFDYYLFIGDETALPAIGRRVEELRSDVPVTTIVLVDGPEDAQTFATACQLSPVWAYRRTGVLEAEVLRDALTAWTAPAGEGFVWIAAEALVAKSLREYMVGERHHPKEWVKAAGYWVRGTPDASERF